MQSDITLRASDTWAGSPFLAMHGGLPAISTTLFNQSAALYFR